MIFARTASCAWQFARIAVVLAAFVTGVSGGSLQAAERVDIQRIESSIIKIYTTSAAPDYFTPWRLMNPSQSSGSGAVISGNRILTNAHVVADASYVQVQKHNDAERYQARVAFISHASDLALLEVDDPAFFDGTPALAIGELPEPNTEVYVFGYPVGGRTLSVTKGILSRVEQQVYAHSGEFLLAGQIDAAINPGNSGGPVIVDGKIAGVVMQSAGGGRTEALGYFVPPDIVKHMLTDASNGRYDGFPDLGFRTQDLESPAAKAAYGLRQDQSGVLVIKVFEDTPAYGVLQENDVLLSIDGYQVAGDSTIRVNKDLQTNYKHAIDLKQIGDPVQLRFARQGEVHEVTLTAQPRQRNYTLVRGEEFDTLPEYYIYGGILFVPLNMNLIKRWGADWTRTAPVNLLHARSQWASPERREVVVALQVLAADVNLGYHDLRNWIVETVNGVPVRDFHHFTRMLRDTQDEFVVFRGESGHQVVVNHQQARATEAGIMAQYRIPAPYSDGLFDEPQLAALP
ncbi:MAG TPA: serine protease [Pseudohongiella sp.]|nr:serine protease [Pseudohongiella sp.]